MTGVQKGTTFLTTTRMVIKGTHPHCENLSFVLNMDREHTAMHVAQSNMLTVVRVSIVNALRSPHCAIQRLLKTAST